MKFKWHVSWRKNFYNVSMPPVLASVREAPDGSNEIVLYNASMQSLFVKVDLAAYDIHSAEKKYQPVWYEPVTWVTD